MSWVCHRGCRPCCTTKSVPQTVATRSHGTTHLGHVVPSRRPSKVTCVADSTNQVKCIYLNHSESRWNSWHISRWLSLQAIHMNTAESSTSSQVRPRCLHNSPKGLPADMSAAVLDRSAHVLKSICTSSYRWAWTPRFDYLHFLPPKWAYWKQRPVQQQARACSKSPTLLVHSHNLKNPFIKKSLRSVSLQDRTYKMRCTKSFDQATVTNVSLELLWVFPVNWTTFPNAPVHLEAYLSKMRGRQLELLQFQSLIKQTFGRI